MDAMLNCDSLRDDVNLYRVLGCDQSSSMSQLLTEYRIRVRNLHPDKAGDDEKNDTTKQNAFLQLQMAKEILTDPHTKRQYDAWLASGIAIPFATWLANKDNLQMTMHWSTPRRQTQAIADASSSTQPEHSPYWSRHESEIARAFRSYAI